MDTKIGVATYGGSGGYMASEPAAGGGGLLMHLSALENRIAKALKTIASYGQTDGEHHKAWVLDQVVRELTGGRYSRWVADYKSGDEGPETYSYDEGIAP